MTAQRRKNFSKLSRYNCSSSICSCCYMLNCAAYRAVTAAILRDPFRGVARCDVRLIRLCEHVNTAFKLACVLAVRQQRWDIHDSACCWLTPKQRSSVRTFVNHTLKLLCSLESTLLIELQSHGAAAPRRYTQIARDKITRTKVHPGSRVRVWPFFLARCCAGIVNLLQSAQHTVVQVLVDAITAGQCLLFHKCYFKRTSNRADSSLARKHIHVHQSADV
jgi:hypothetical protein